MSNSTKLLRYDVVNVFISDGNVYSGNPLAVIYGGEHLTQAQGLVLARRKRSRETTADCTLTYNKSHNRAESQRSHVSRKARVITTVIPHSHIHTGQGSSVRRPSYTRNCFRVRSTSRKVRISTNGDCLAAYCMVA